MFLNRDQPHVRVRTNRSSNNGKTIWNRTESGVDNLWPVTAWNRSANLEQQSSICINRLNGLRLGRELGASDIEGDVATAMSPVVLGQIVGARECLATLIALERLIARVERAVMTLKVLLSTEAAIADPANKLLGGVIGKRLLTTTAVLGRGTRNYIRFLRIYILGFWSRRGILLGLDLLGHRLLRN